MKRQAEAPRQSETALYTFSKVTQARSELAASPESLTPSGDDVGRSVEVAVIDRARETPGYHSYCADHPRTPKAATVEDTAIVTRRRPIIPSAKRNGLNAQRQQHPNRALVSQTPLTAPR